MRLKTNVMRKRYIFDLGFIRNRTILHLCHIELHHLFKLESLVCFIDQVSNTSFHREKERTKLLQCKFFVLC